MKKVIIWVCILGLTIILGCSSFQDAVTPCYISPAALEYADVEPTTFLPFTTLFDARRVDFRVDFVHTVNQTTDRLKYEFLKGLSAFHISGAEQLQATVFSPSGPIGLLLPTLMGGTLGALLISKPDDKKKIVDLETKINGKTK